MNVIGNKTSIAIEYVLTDSVELMGYARFWFSNQPLGSLEDLIYFEGYLLGCLEDLLHKPDLPECRTGLGKAYFLVESAPSSLLRKGYSLNVYEGRRYVAVVEVV